jgi:hypothetical protein
MKRMFAVLLALQIVGVPNFASGGNETQHSGVSSTVEERDAHELFSDVLGDHVKDGRVDYPALCADPRFESYLKRLSSTDPDALSGENEQLAFWINAYNAFTLKIICDNYPVESINDLHFGGLIVGTVTKKTVWHKKFIVINGEKMSLDHIEHDIVRPVFGDPRAHFGLVCASVSCPPLRSEAFEGVVLDTQLDEQARIFFSQRDKNYFDLEKREAHLSKIFDWFSKDFGENDEEILLFVSQYLEPELADAIKHDSKEWDIKHTDYDWDLNE